MSIAFFDVDGTLIPHPSLERRFVWKLFRQGIIPLTNYLLWAAQIFRTNAAHLATAVQSNKVYLSGVSTGVMFQFEARLDRWVPAFFPAAIQRVWFHAARGDEIVLVTGTLAPLAEIVKAALERELLWRGVETQITVIATRLETNNNRWTGHIDGPPMFAEAKQIAATESASSRGIPLSECFAYGDHLLDRSLLQAVGNPVAVNPDVNLLRIAHQNGWQVARWSPCPPRTANTRHALKWRGQVAR